MHSGLACQQVIIQALLYRHPCSDLPLLSFWLFCGWFHSLWVKLITFLLETNYIDSVNATLLMYVHSVEKNILQNGNMWLSSMWRFCFDQFVYYFEYPNKDFDKMPRGGPWNGEEVIQLWGGSKLRCSSRTFFCSLGGSLDPSRKYCKGFLQHLAYR